ncbi:MAG: tRNA 2-thiouridine(34) synthase MnmA [Planctomycetia bacterium]|nr:tRNA 2-thiouridine(34) synthase MnmA [Planctomycetia bacterium]
MSGGVDSSVAAALLVEAGHDCAGVFMRHGGPPAPEAASPGPLQFVDATACPPAGKSGHQGCCSADDARDARRVADRLGIPLYALDLSDDFGRIIDYFATEYGRGRTPNPCVRCNSWLKFGRLFDYADAIDATHVATGHYARLRVTVGGEPRLHRGLDPARDQSYVLFEVGPERLRRMLLPVGDLAKAEVRRRAAALGLETADKPDSQEICFVPPGEHARLVSQRLGGSRAGDIVTVAGRVLGRHDGIERFTVGQRHGLGVAVGSPLFVVRIDAASRRVVVGPREEVPQRELVAADATWFDGPPAGPVECLVQCRAQRAAAPALVTPLPGGRFTARFVDDPDRSPGPISPGQPAVCYDGDRVLGGGWIES